MAKYYYPNGDLIKDLENFVDFYSKMYFYWQDLAQEVRIVEILSSGLEMNPDSSLPSSRVTVMNLFRYGFKSTLLI